MSRPRLIKGLRIAWTAWWGIVCGLVVMLWVRSYIFYDRCNVPMPRQSGISVTTGQGEMQFRIDFVTDWNPNFWWPKGLSLNEKAGRERIARNRERWLQILNHSMLGFGYRITPDWWLVITPLWFLVLFVITLAYLPWLPLSLSFSLRTLLIATTLIAVVLGLVVWSMSSRRMERTKVVRGLGMAWTAWWGILCVLLVVLWVRSYTWRDVTSAPVSGARAIAFSTIPGRFTIEIRDTTRKAFQHTLDWQVETSSSESFQDYLDRIAKGHAKMGRKFWPITSVHIRFSGATKVIPYWLPTVIVATLIAAPWIPWSKGFSLRTLLIAITLVAVVLGLVVYSF